MKFFDDEAMDDATEEQGGDNQEGTEEGGDMDNGGESDEGAM